MTSEAPPPLFDDPPGWVTHRYYQASSCGRFRVSAGARKVQIDDEAWALEWRYLAYQRRQSQRGAEVWEIIGQVQQTAGEARALCRSG